MEATDWPHWECDRACWWQLSPASRRTIVGGHAKFREAGEGGNGGIEQSGDLRQPAGEVASATLCRTEATSDQWEEPTANDRDGMERIPRLRLHLLQFEADRANRAERQVAIAEIVGAEARHWDGNQPSLFAVTPVQPCRATGGAMLAPRSVVIVDPHPRCGNGVQRREAGKEAGGVEGINHRRQGTISTWVHKTQPTLSSSC